MKSLRQMLKLTDLTLVLLCLTCTGISVLAITSICHANASSAQSMFVNYRMAIVQAGAAVLGLILALILSRFDYHRLAEIWPIHAGIAWLLVLLTFVIGYAPSGTDNRSWIQLPLGLSLQPTELAKISFILTFAYHLSNVKDKMDEPSAVLALFAHLCIPLAIIHVQGDDGTALVFLLIGLTMLVAAGLPRRVVLLGFGLFALAVPLVWNFGMKGYQKDRIVALFSPDSYPDIMWQQNLAKIAIGSGEIAGRGFMNVDHYAVPKSENDFIFSYIAESAGFAGSVVVLILLFCIVARLIATSFRSQDRLGALICVGIASVVIWQTIINVGMNLSLLPVIGITLPFFTAGGTSEMMLYLCMGVALSVYRFNDRNLFDA